MLCFGKFPVTNIFMDEKRVVSNSYVEFFCLTLSKNAEGEQFSLSLISGIEKNRMRGWGGECQDFSSKNSCLPVPKKFVG